MQQPDGTLALPTKKGCLFIHIKLYIDINSAIVEIVFKQAPLCWCSNRGILMLTLVSQMMFQGCCSTPSSRCNLDASTISVTTRTYLCPVTAIISLPSRPAL